MSAWVVTKRHIDYLVTAIDKYEPSYDRDRKSKELDRIGQVLWDKNFESVKFRYPDNKITELPGYPLKGRRKYKFKPFSGEITAVQTLKAITCLDYQSCEHPKWEKSRAKQILDNLAFLVVRSLPGYEDAPWGIE